MAIGRGVAHGEQDKRLFVFRSLADLTQKRHGRRSVGEGGETGAVKRLDEKAYSDADGLRHVVILDSLLVRPKFVVMTEDDDEPWSIGEVRLVEISPEGSEGV